MDGRSAPRVDAFVYWNGSYQVSEAWEVVGQPEPSGSDDWSWETPVRLAVRVPGVTLTDLGIRPQTLARRVRLHLRPEQEALFESSFNG
jgi:hypothetical protein